MKISPSIPAFLQHCCFTARSVSWPGMMAEKLILEPWPTQGRLQLVALSSGFRIFLGKGSDPPTLSVLPELQALVNTVTWRPWGLRNSCPPSPSPIPIDSSQKEEQAGRRQKSESGGDNVVGHIPRKETPGSPRHGARPEKRCGFLCHGRWHSHRVSLRASFLQWQSPVLE